METALYVLQALMTKEVITVFASLAAAWAGWKVLAKIWGITSSILQKTSFLGLTAALLLLIGTGGIGLGGGEIVARVFGSTKSPKSALSNTDLVALASTCQTPELAKGVFDYAKLVDLNQNPNSNSISPQRLASIVENSNEGNRAAVIALVEYAKMKESNRRNTTTNLVSNNDNEVYSASADFTENTVSTKATVLSDSKFSLPYALSLMGLGFGSIVSAAWMNRHRLQSVPVNCR